MALRGNLRDFTITQLLNLINLASKTGTLIVDGPSEQAQVSFRDGKLAYARIGKDDGRLAFVLHRANKLNSNQYRAISERGGGMSDKELGLLLINAGYVTQEDILLNLQGYFTDVLRQLFTWVEGIFRFEAGMPPPDDRINVRLDLETRRTGARCRRQETRARARHARGCPCRLPSSVRRLQVRRPSGESGRRSDSHSPTRCRTSRRPSPSFRRSRSC